MYSCWAPSESRGKVPEETAHVNQKLSGGQSTRSFIRQQFFIFQCVSLLRKCHTCFFLSFLRKQESSEVKGFWTPASAGVTAFL